jgi:hypothetical protein
VTALRRAAAGRQEIVKLVLCNMRAVGPG